MEIYEYQTIRPSGDLVQSVLVPDGVSYSREVEEPGFEIRGPIITRWRTLPGGPWTVTAYYPDGFLSEPSTSIPDGQFLE